MTQIYKRSTGGGGGGNITLQTPNGNAVSAGGVIVVDTSTLDISATGNTITFNQSTSPQIVELNDDWVSGQSDGRGNIGWQVSNGGGSTSFVSNLVDPDHPGTIALFTDTGPFANIGIGLGNNAMTFGGGAVTERWILNIDRLSDAGSRYTLCIGFGDNLSNTPNTGVYFFYSDNVNGGSWQLIAANNGTTTVTNSAIAATTGWHDFQINVNAAGTLATFIIDGVTAGTVATNIPSGGGTSRCAPQVNINNGNPIVAGTTITIDYFYLQQILTNPR